MLILKNFLSSWLSPSLGLNTLTFKSKATCGRQDKSFWFHFEGRNWLLFYILSGKFFGNVCLNSTLHYQECINETTREKNEVKQVGNANTISWKHLLLCFQIFILISQTLFLWKETAHFLTHRCNGVVNYL